MVFGKLLAKISNNKVIIHLKTTYTIHDKFVQ
jgi:hypothetical protein